MKKTAKDICTNDRFTYLGAFTTYRAVSDPVPDTEIPSRVTFEVVNERWGPGRNKTPIGIRLEAELDVEVEDNPPAPAKLPQVLVDALHQLHAAGVGTLRIQGLVKEFMREPYLLETRGLAQCIRTGNGSLYSVSITETQVDDDAGGYRVYFGLDNRKCGRCDAYGSARGDWKPNGQWEWVPAENEEQPTDEPIEWWDQMARVCERLGEERKQT